MTIAFTIVEDLEFEVKINHPNRMYVQKVSYRRVEWCRKRKKIEK